MGKLFVEFMEIVSSNSSSVHVVQPFSLLGHCHPNLNFANTYIRKVRKKTTQIKLLWFVIGMICTIPQKARPCN